MTFLEEWDEAIAAARIQGKPGRIWNFERTNTDPFPIGRLVARTMHPSFMAGVVVKHDRPRHRLSSLALFRDMQGQMDQVQEEFMGFLSKDKGTGR